MWDKNSGSKYLIFLNFFLESGLRELPLHSVPEGPQTNVASTPLSEGLLSNSTSSPSSRLLNPDLWTTDDKKKWKIFKIWNLKQTFIVYIFNRSNKKIASIIDQWIKIIIMYIFYIHNSIKKNIKCKISIKKSNECCVSILYQFTTQIQLFLLLHF